MPEPGHAAPWLRRSVMSSLESVILRRREDAGVDGCYRDDVFRFIGRFAFKRRSLNKKLYSFSIGMI